MVKHKDDIDIAFEEDKKVTDTWKNIRVITHKEDLDNIYQNIDLYLQKMIFEKDGEIIIKYTNGLKSSKYTKGKIVNLCREDTLSEYKIKEKDGNEYLIAEWKSGDYVYGGMVNCYYVLIKE